MLKSMIRGTPNRGATAYCSTPSATGRISHRAANSSQMGRMTTARDTRPRAPVRVRIWLRTPTTTIMPTSSFRFFTVVMAVSMMFTFLGLQMSTAAPESMKIMGRPNTGHQAGKMRAPMIRTIMTTKGTKARMMFQPPGASGRVPRTSSTGLEFRTPRVR